MALFQVLSARSGEHTCDLDVKPAANVRRPMVMDIGVSKNRGKTPPNHPFVHRVSHYKPSILGYQYFWKYPYINYIIGADFFSFFWSPPPKFSTQQKKENNKNPPCFFFFFLKTSQNTFPPQNQFNWTPLEKPCEVDSIFRLLDGTVAPRHRLAGRSWRFSHRSPWIEPMDRNAEVEYHSQSLNNWIPARLPWYLTWFWGWKSSVVVRVLGLETTSDYMSITPFSSILHQMHLGWLLIPTVLRQFDQSNFRKIKMAYNWLALSREWGNQPLHWYIWDSFPHSLLRAS